MITFKFNLDLLQACKKMNIKHTKGKGFIILFPNEHITIDKLAKIASLYNTKILNISDKVALI